MTTDECKEPDCDKPVLCRAMCNKHYTSWYRRTRPASDRKPRTDEYQAKGGVKKCTKCLQVLTVGEFHNADNARDGYRYSCKLCTVVAGYGMTREDFLTMMELQEGRCLICWTDISDNWHIDHDHVCCPRGSRKKCGECNRALLCALCNQGLGFFRDRADLLRSAISYLSRL